MFESKFSRGTPQSHFPPQIEGSNIMARSQKVLRKWVRVEQKLRRKTNRVNRLELQMKEKEGEKAAAEANVKTISSEITTLKTRMAALSEQIITDEDVAENLEGKMRRFNVIHISSKDDLEFLREKGVYGARLSMAECSIGEILTLLPLCQSYGFQV